MPKDKKKKNNFKITTIFLIIILMLFSFGFVYMFSQQTKVISKLENTNKILKSELENKNNLINEYKEEIYNLENEYLELKNNYSNLNIDYNTLKNETNTIIDKIDQYMQRIEESITWFSYNSNFGDTKLEKIAKTKVYDLCHIDDDDFCYIKTGCFYLVNSEELKLDYKLDFTDKMLSLTDFLENKGGDCEDYSLFVKAQYNYIKNKCKDKEIILESWREPQIGEGYGVDHWLDQKKNWYIERVIEVEIKEYIHPNIICGNFYDSYLDEIIGHCMLAFTKEEITSISNITNLENGYIIEPQDGSFYGNINQENSNFYILTKDTEPLIYASYIDTIITDNDFISFNYEEEKWESYTYFYGLLEEQKNQIIID